MEPATYGSVDLPPLALGAEPRRPPPPRRPVSPRSAAGALALLSLFIAFVLVSVQRYDNRVENKRAATTSFRRGSSALYSKPKTTVSRTKRAVDSSDSLEYEVENKYRTYTRLESDYPWLDDGKLIEPSRDTTLRLLNPVSGYTYLWTFYSSEGESVAELEGSEVTVKLSITGAYALSLVAMDSDKNEVASSKETVYVKYVRRELRALDEEDRKTFFDAMEAVWKTETEAGQSLYGGDFYNIDYFNKYHLLQASSFSCDHMHDGLGFMTQHVALTVKFERALQAVAPAVALPYWDFTIDAEDIFAHKDGNFTQYWFETEVFDDDWFGRVDSTEHTMTKGRWAYTQVKKGDSDAGDVMNSYGYLRAPWNANGNKYVTRYNTFCGEDYSNLVLQFPGCKSHYNAVAGYNTFSDFGWFLPYDPHGPVHVLIGGTFGCEEAWAQMRQFKLGEDFYQWLAMFSFMTLKNLYRGGFLTCPASGACTEDTPQSECRCSCPNFEEDVLSGEWTNYFKTAVGTIPQTEIVYAQDDATQIEFIRLLCNAGIMDGDQLESASPMDPSFWPIHPTIERLYVLKKLRGYFTDESWPSIGTSSYGDDCTGHSADDVIPLLGIFTNDHTLLTNAQLLSKMDPSSDGMPYIFEHFEWDHCTSVGADFGSMVVGETLDYGPF